MSPGRGRRSGRSRARRAGGDERRADEDAVMLVDEEVGEGASGLGVRQCEGRREVVDDRGADALGLEAGE